jgi:hypothetical protein
MNKKLILIISLLNSILNSTDPLDTTCSLIPSAQALLGNPCFDKISTIISCLSACEQVLWVKAYKANQHPDKCFECTAISQSALKACAVERANEIAAKASRKYEELRKSISCLKDFERDNLSGNFEFVEMTSGQLDAIVDQQQSTGNCYKTFIKNMININIRRRRYLCVSNNIRDDNVFSMDQDERITQFKFTVSEANKIVGSFRMYADCSTQLKSTIATSVQIITEAASESPECSNGTRLLTSDNSSEDLDTDPDDSISVSPSPFLTVSNSPPTDSHMIGRYHGVTLGTDISTYFTSLTSEVTAYPDLITSLQNAEASIKTEGVICDPSVIPQLFSNIQQTESAHRMTIQNIISMTKETYTCTAESDFVYSISNKKVNCQGFCPFTGFTFNWISESRAFSFYELWIGCIHNTTFVLSNIFTGGKSVIEFKYNTPVAAFNLSKRCHQRLSTCIPGKNRDTNTQDGPCPADRMKSQCTESLDKVCAASGFNDMLETITSSNGNIPTPCQGVDPSLSLSATFSSTTTHSSSTASPEVASCLSFINSKILNGLSNNNEGIINPEIAFIPETRRLDEDTMDNMFTNIQISDNSDLLKTSISESDFVMDTDKDSAISQITNETAESGSTWHGRLFFTFGFLGILII